ncbi:hypothetical protein MTO96_051787 [Rhipicephalus appendiculatus]
MQTSIALTCEKRRRRRRRRGHFHSSVRCRPVSSDSDRKQGRQDEDESPDFRGEEHLRRSFGGFPHKTRKRATTVTAVRRARVVCWRPRLIRHGERYTR